MMAAGQSASVLPRRAVVLFLPPPVDELVDEIRLRWDPVMAGRIGAHITLIHDVVDHELADGLVRDLAATVVPFDVRLTDAAHWGKAAYGVYLRIDDPDAAVSALQSRLVTVESASWSRVSFHPHVTLVHSRTTAPDVAVQAWAALDGFDAGWDITVDAVDVVELGDTGWRTVSRHPLAAAAVAD